MDIIQRELEYNLKVPSTIISLIDQRLKYLLHGNLHGVSIGWILNNNSVLIDALGFLVKRGHSEYEARKVLDKGKNLYKELRISSASRSYSQRFDSGAELASLLYSVVVLEKPRNLVETGVANGISTNLILKALEEVGGTLHSFDLDPEVKNVYKGKADWRLYVLRSRRTKKDFKKAIKDFNNIDLWLHDSNHGFNWQFFEYNFALTKLKSSGSILISDDIDASTAWCTLVNKYNMESSVIFDSRKFIGILEK